MITHYRTIFKGVKAIFENNSKLYTYIVKNFKTALKLDFF